MTSMRVAMIGYGFMGAAHSQGWRVAPRFFDLPAHARDEPARGPQRRMPWQPPADKWGWAETATDWRAAIAPRRHRHHRHRDPGRLARRDRDRRPRGRQARAVREAPRQHRRRGRGDGGRRRSAPPPAASTRWSASPTAAFRRPPSPASSSPRAPSATCARCAPSYLQDWLVDETAPARVAPAEGARRIGRARRHRRPRHRPRPVHHRPATHERLRHHRHHRHASARCSPRAAGSRRHRRHRDSAPSPSTTSPCSPAASRRACSAAFVATRIRTGRKNALRIEVSGSRGAIAFDLEDLNALQVYDRTAPADRQGFTKVLVTEPRASVRRRLVAGRPHARLRARLRAPGEGLRRGDRRPGTQPTAVVRRRPARCSACSAPSSRAPATAAPGPRFA